MTRALPFLVLEMLAADPRSRCAACSFLPAGAQAPGEFDVAFVDAGVTQASVFVSTASNTLVGNGTANFSCNQNPAASSPCLANFNHSLELGGFHASTPQDNSSDVYVGCMEEKDGGSCLDVLQCYGAGGGCSERAILRAKWDGSLEVAGVFLRLNTTTSASGGRITSPNGGIYLVSTSGEILVENDSSGSPIMEWYSGAGPTLRGTFTAAGGLKLATGPSRGTCVLNGGSPSTCTATVESGAVCGCYAQGTTAAAAIAVAANVASTTLTCTGANGLTNTVAYHCL